MRKRIFPFLLLVLPATALATPSGISNQHPLGLVHLSTTPIGAETLPAGTSELKLSGAISNTLNREEDAFRIDAETREGALAYSYGLSPGLELSLRQAVDYRGGGHTDQAIDEWHKFFGLPRGPRRHTSKDQYVIEGVTKEGEDFSLERHGTAMSDLDVGVKYELWNDLLDESVLSIVPVMRLPTGADTFGQDSVDTGLTLVASTKLGRFDFTAGLSYAYFFDSTLSGIRYSRNHYGAFAGVEYQLTDSFSAVLDVLAESALVDNIAEYPDYQTYLDAGVRWWTTDSVGLEFFFREDPAPEDGTTDFTLFGALRLRFGA